MKRPEPLSKSKLSVLQKLFSKKQRRSSDAFLVEGSRIVTEALASEWEVKMVLVTEPFMQHSEYGQVSKLAADRLAPLHIIRVRDLETITNTEHPAGVAAVIRPKQHKFESLVDKSSERLIVALDAISDPGNFGTILRTCDWFKADALLVGKGSVDLFNPKVVRSTMGSLFRVPTATDVDLPEALRSLKAEGFRVYAASVGDGQPINRVRFSNRVVLVFGSEAHGLSESVGKAADEFMTIPRIGAAESLNVSAAAAIVLAFARLLYSK